MRIGTTQQNRAKIEALEPRALFADATVLVGGIGDGSSTFPNVEPQPTPLAAPHTGVGAPAAGVSGGMLPAALTGSHSSLVGSVGDGSSTFPNVEPEPTPLPASSATPPQAPGAGVGGGSVDAESVPGDGSSTFPAVEPEPQPLPPASSNHNPGTSGTNSNGATPSNGPRVVSFSFISAGANQAIPGFEVLIDGAVIDLAYLPTRNLNIRANVTGDVASVQFGYDANEAYRTDSTNPWTLIADDRGKGMTPTLGAHTITATPADAGQTGESTVLHLYITDSGAGYARATPFSSRAINANDWFTKRDEE